MKWFKKLETWALKRMFVDSYVARHDAEVAELQNTVRVLKEDVGLIARYQAILERLIQGEPPTYCDACRDFAQFSTKWIINLPEDQKMLLVHRSPQEVAKYLYDVWLERIPREAAKTAFSSWIELGEWPKIEKVDLAKCIDEVIKEEAEMVKRFKAGETKLAGPLIGKVNKKCKGTSTVDDIKKQLMEKLKNG